MMEHLRQAWQRIAGGTLPEGLEIRSRDYRDPFTFGEPRLKDEVRIYTAFVPGDPNSIAYIRLRQRISDNAWEVWNVYCHADYRRRGIASELISRARADLGHIDHAPMDERSTDGKRWSDHVGHVDIS